MGEALRAAVFAVLQAALLLAAAPLLHGVIKKMKAAFQTRQGPPLLQSYYDIAKLLRKEPIRSETTTWVYAAGPRVYFATAVAATTLVPVFVTAAPLEAVGGILLLVGTLALGRFALASAALDTGSPFGGMGSSREMTIAALAEPALMLGLFASALAAGSLNLGTLVRGLAEQGPSLHPSDLLGFASLFIILIAESGRVPVDNPATHLELTMIHEAIRAQRAAVPDAARGSVCADRHRDDPHPGDRADRGDGLEHEGVPVRLRRHARREYERQAAAIPRPRTGRDIARSRLPGARHQVPVRCCA
jgi:formate hydrogenlyase subunit 4